MKLINIFIIVMMIANPVCAGNSNSEDVVSYEDYERIAAQIIEAVKHNPGNKSMKEDLSKVYLNQALALKKEGKTDYAIDILEKASDLHINNPHIYSLLAVLYFEKGKLIDAKKNTGIYLIYKPSDPFMLKLNTKIDYFLEKPDAAIAGYNYLKTKYSINLPAFDYEKLNEEKNIILSYGKLNSHPFTIYYPGESYKEKADKISTALINSYFKMKNWVGFKAETVISVYLYPQGIFDRFADVGFHINGYYDGKIRISADKTNLEDLQKTAVHEFTHHVLSVCTNRNAPFWLNEGLAQYVAGQWGQCREELLGNAIKNNGLIKFSELDDADVRMFSPENIKLAYLQSYAAVDYLIDQYGYGIIPELINGLKTNKSAESALIEITLINYNELKCEIQNYLKEKHNPT